MTPRAPGQADPPGSGELSSDPDAGDPDVSSSGLEPSRPLPGWTRHYLILGSAPSAEELEALVVSRVTQAIRVDARTLGWEPGVLIRGPLTAAEVEGVGAVVSGSTALPEWADTVYAVDSPHQRGTPIPVELQLPGGLIDTFEDGEPIGVERDTLETLEAMARRLGGGVLTDHGRLVIADVRADLILFTSTWLDAQGLTTAISDVVEMTLDDRLDLPPHIDPGDEYGLVAPLPRGAVLSISASEAQVMPLALAGYPWATGAIYVYEIRHYSGEEFSFTATPRIPRTPAEAEEVVDVQAITLVEAAARAVFDATGAQLSGHLCDDDGFLVIL